MVKKLSGKELVFVKNLFLTTILGGIVGILNYFFNVFIARYTDQSIFSTFSSALGVIYLVQIPATAIQAVITKGIAQNKQKDLEQYKWGSFLTFAGIGLLASISFYLVRIPISNIASIPQDLVLFLAITMFFAFVTPVAKGLLLGLEKITTVNLVLLGETIAKFVMGWIAIQMGGDIPLLILGNAIPGIVSTLIILPLVRFDQKSSERVKINYKELLLVTISFLLLIAPFTIDLILVNPSFRAEYGAISLLGKLVYFGSTTTAAVMFARLTNESVERDQKRSLLISLVMSVSIGLFVSLIFFLFSMDVVGVTVGSQYGAITQYIGVFGLCMTGFAFVSMVANYFISKGSFRYLYVLFASTLLQVLLFILRNDSLDMVIKNQILVYSFLTVSTFVYLLFKLKRIGDGKEKNF